MTWAFTIGGMILGAALWGGPGFVVLGFFGWLTGLIVSSMRKPPQSVPLASAPTAAKVPAKSEDPIVQRLEAIESRLAILEAHAGISPRKVIAAKEEVQAIIEASKTPEPAPEPRPEPQPATPPPPPIPAKPNPIIAWFMGGNTIVRVGLVVLFFGLAFLVKYGVDHDMVPIELRVAGVAAAGIVLLVIGWRLREKRREYGLSFQGAGIAVLYLTIFGAMRLYNMIPPPLAFALLVAIAVFSGLLAVMQDSLWLAVFAAAGGFLAPILASTGQGSHVMLFSYYLVLNATIVGIAWFKAWRILNLVGFVFTALIGLAWGERSYRDELFASTEPFLIAFFLMYVAIAVLFARQQAARGERIVDGTIVFGNPIFAFGMQAGMLHDTEFGLAWSCVALAAFYMAAAWTLTRPSPKGEGASARWKLLAESFLAMGVVFGSLAIPLALDARWTSAAWALEGAAVFWIGMRQDRKLARAFAVLLQIGGGVAFLMAADSMPPGPPLADALFVGALILSLAGYWTNWFMSRSAVATKLEKVVAPLFFLWALFWLIVAGGHEIQTFVPNMLGDAAWVIFLSAIALGFGMASVKWSWREASWPGFALGPILLVLALVSWRSNLFAYLGWLAWPVGIATHFWLLKNVYQVQISGGKYRKFLHALGPVIVAVVGTVELEWVATQVTAPHTAWALAARIVAPALVLLLIASRAADTRWPVASAPRVYRLGAAAALVVAMAVWSLHVNLSHGGGSDPLPYLPLLNALDLAHILGLMAIGATALAIRRSQLTPPAFFTAKPTVVVGCAIAFIWANAVLLRTIHHWAGVSYRPFSLWHSVLVQAALSIFWAFLALALMVFATRKGKRGIWMLGASLMGVVLAKMVLVDLGHLSGIERIVSFIGVGVLMLVIGYFSPVPPKNKEPIDPLQDERGMA